MNFRKPLKRKKQKRTWIWNFSNTKIVPSSNIAPTTVATPQPTTATQLPTKVHKTNLTILKSDAWENKRYNDAAYSVTLSNNKCKKIQAI